MNRFEVGMEWTLESKQCVPTK